MFAIPPQQSCSFRCWFSNNSVLTFLEGCFPNSIVVEVIIFILRYLIPTIYLLFVRPKGIVMLLSSTNHLVLSRSCNFSFLIRLAGVSCFHSSSLILSSFVSFLNRSAVWNLSYPLCHSFISFGGNVLLISSSILSSCQDHVQFLPFTVGVLPKLYHSYSFSILFNRSVVSIIPLLTGLSSKCFHFAKFIFYAFHF